MNDMKELFIQYKGILKDLLRYGVLKTEALEYNGKLGMTILFYAFIGIVAIIWGYFYVPETKGVSLENIEAFWRKGGHPKDKII